MNPAALDHEDGIGGQAHVTGAGPTWMSLIGKATPCGLTLGGPNYVGA